MLAKLRQSECAQGFVHLMYDFLEMLGKVMEFMLPPGSAVCGNGQQLFPVRARSPLMRMSAHRRRWTSRDLSRTDVLAISIQQGIHSRGVRSRSNL